MKKKMKSKGYAKGGAKMMKASMGMAAKKSALKKKGFKVVKIK